MDIRKTLEEAKRKVAEGGKAIDQKIEKGLCRSHLLLGDALLMQECACALTSVYGARGYSTQSFRFTEEGTIGTLVQIGNQSEGWKQKHAATLGGQQIAVNVRFFPQGNDLDVSIDCGKWVDKALSGVLAWTVFAPLVALPVVGFWRQKRLTERMECEILEWIAARHRAGCIDV